MNQTISCGSAGREVMDYELNCYDVCSLGRGSNDEITGSITGL
jgi:hypothetical protein